MCVQLTLAYVYMLPSFSFCPLVTSATSGGILDRAIEAEDKKHGDFLRLVFAFVSSTTDTLAHFGPILNNASNTRHYNDGSYC